MLHPNAPLGKTAWLKYPAALTAAAAMVAAAVAPAAFANEHGGTGTNPVSYRGYVFDIPRSWQVVPLTAGSHECVRANQHALYLGTPGAGEACPSRGAGQATEAILVQPAAPSGAARSVRDPVARQITVTAPRIRVTATYATDQDEILNILASAALPAPVTRMPGSQTARAVHARSVAGQGLVGESGGTVGPGSSSYLGQGFDTCTAPSSATMAAWRQTSPYQAVGIYIGGSERACLQPNLTAGWVSSQARAGWRFIPLYVGPQAEFGQITSPASQAASAAEDAVSQAESLGFAPGTPIYYDMEAPCAGCTANPLSTVLAFLSDWSGELHRLGYESGVYSSSDYAVKALADNYTRYTMPDVIDDALWNGHADTSDPNVPAGEWGSHHRIHQYQGNVTQSYGGDQLTIDQDYLDVNVAPQPPRTPPPGVPGGPAAYDPLSHTLDVYGTGTDGRLDESFWAARHGWRSLELPGSPGPVAGRPSAVYNPLSRNLEVYATGTGGQLEEFYYAPGKGWRTKQLAGPPDPLAGSPSAVYDPLDGGHLEVYARGAGGELEESYWAPGKGWRTTQLAGPPDPLAGSPSAVYDPLDKVLEVYATGAGGKLEEYFWTPGHGWHSLEQTPAGSALTGSPSAVYDPLDGGHLEVYATGAGGELEEFYYTPGKEWRTQQLTGAPDPLAGSPSAVYDPLDKVLEVYATGAGGKLEEDFLTPGHGWMYKELTSTAFASVTGRPFAVYDDVGKHLEVYAVTGTAALGEYYYAPGSGWNSRSLGGKLAGL